MVDLPQELCVLILVYASVLFGTVTVTMIGCKKKRRYSDSLGLTQATQDDTVTSSVVSSIAPEVTGTDGNEFKWDAKLKTDDEEKCNTDLDDLEDDNPLQNPKLREKLGKGKASGKEKKNDKAEPNGKNGQKAPVRTKKSHEACPKGARKMPPSTAAPPTATAPAPRTSALPAPSPSAPAAPSKPEKCATVTQASQMVEPTMEAATQSAYNATTVTQVGGVSKEPTPIQTKSQFGQTTQADDVSRIQPSQIQKSLLPSEVSVDIPQAPSMMHSISVVPAPNDEKKKKHHSQKKQHSKRGDKSADKQHRTKTVESSGKGKAGNNDGKFQQAKESSSHDGSTLSNQSSHTSSVKNDNAGKDMPADSLMQPPVGTSSPDGQKKRVASKSVMSDANAR